MPMRGRGLAVPGMAAVAELAREAGAVLLADEPERDVAHHVTGLAKGAEQVEGVTSRANAQVSSSTVPEPSRGR
jgi:hypothetical protein